ncbi:xanthine dehydrogenase accessory protein XdhC [Deinococcus aquiradiocola]|uniref:Xanthine dehydrogenase accessory protein XdhC n=1 Tax=Deinococcus aquiradiocola TaxID=393059 RepID=A0A917UNL1_9DEIO|nr:xanthine dehydrogenase accessory protein XdhC [Deinococcus aquiradiocola]GGJ70800.1 xanthine dehydrogenase accessory protein XdhC [Deinococcus aquiradiocola]
MTPPGWLAALQAAQARGEAAVLVTLAAVRGHAPREAGAKMVVTRHATHGSVGGGNLEATAVQRARDLLDRPHAGPELLTLRLTDRAPAEHGRQCCGGEVTLLLDPARTARAAVAVFGVGHVGLAVARVLATLDVDLHLIDSRAAQLVPERLEVVTRDAQATVHVHHSPIPELVLPLLPPGAHLLVMTHDHAEDAAVLDAALRGPPGGFLGLIGSSVKWSRFQAQLRDLGHAPEVLARVTTPIGVPGIHSKRPERIALAVAAQIAQQLEPHPEPNLSSTLHPSLSAFPNPDAQPSDPEPLMTHPITR